MQRKDLTMDPHFGGHERTVRRALGVPSTSEMLHQTRGPVNQCKYVCAEKCPLTMRHTAERSGDSCGEPMRHMANAAVAPAEEQECRALLEELRWETSPETEAEHARHGRIHAQTLSGADLGWTAVCTKIWSGPVWYWSVQQPHTSEQFATMQFMERHENVTQGAKDKQERQAARSSTDESLREASRPSKHDCDGRLDDPLERKPEDKEDC